MKANELRIGNLVLAEVGLPFLEVHIIKAGDIVDFKKDRIKCYPIELSEEWLLRVGFKRIEKDWYYKGVFVHTRKRGFVVRRSIPIIKHVHQLQNLFYALKGEELIYNKVK